MKNSFGITVLCVVSFLFFSLLVLFYWSLNETTHHSINYKIKCIFMLHRSSVVHMKIYKIAVCRSIMFRQHGIKIIEATSPLNRRILKFHIYCSFIFLSIRMIGRNEIFVFHFLNAFQNKFMFYIRGAWLNDNSIRFWVPQCLFNRSIY